MIGATRMYGQPNTRHDVQNHSGIATRCLVCGGTLDRAGMDLAYCEDCGAEYMTSLTRAHNYTLRRVPR